MNVHTMRIMDKQVKNPGRNATKAARVDMTLDKALADDAKAPVSLSKASDQGLAGTDKAARSERWLEENREAPVAWNDWVAKNGIPLAKYRML